MQIPGLHGRKRQLQANHLHQSLTREDKEKRKCESCRIVEEKRRGVELTALRSAPSPHRRLSLSFSLIQIVLLQPFGEVVAVKKKCLQRPIIHSVCNVDMGVFNLSLSLCFYLSSSVSLRLCFPVFVFVSTIINHL